MLKMSCAALALAAAGCAAQKAAETPAPVLSSAEPVVVVERGRIVDDSELICHWEAKTGTRLQKKVCLTRAERALLAEESQKFLKELQHKATIAPN